MQCVARLLANDNADVAVVAKPVFQPHGVGDIGGIVHHDDDLDLAAAAGGEVELVALVDELRLPPCFSPRCAPGGASCPEGEKPTGGAGTFFSMFWRIVGWLFLTVSK